MPTFITFEPTQMHGRPAVKAKGFTRQNYSEPFKANMNSIKGHWNHDEQTWTFLAQYENQVREWTDKYFPSVNANGSAQTTQNDANDFINTVNEAIRLQVANKFRQVENKLDEFKRNNAQQSLEVNTRMSELVLAVEKSLKHVESFDADVAATVSKYVNEFEQRFNELSDKVIKPTIVVIKHHETGASSNDVIIDAGVCHEKFPLVLKTLNNLDNGDRNIWLTGPSGSGKTSLAKQLAKALNLSFTFSGALIDSTQLFGFRDAGGHVEVTPFRVTWSGGGVHLLDEIDGSNPTVLPEINAVLANGICAFPDAIIERHPDCIIMAAANTWGFGPTDNYVGRARQDAASLDRFVTIEINYDEKFERALANNDEWVSIVQALRKAAASAGAKIVISPRASIKGAKLLAGGDLTRAEIAELIFGRYFSMSTWPSFSKVLTDWVAAEPKTSVPQTTTATNNLPRFATIKSYDRDFKLNAIKFVRDASGMGLKEAKDLVEAPMPQTIVLLNGITLAQVIVAATEAHVEVTV